MKIPTPIFWGSFIGTALGGTIIFKEYVIGGKQYTKGTSAKGLTAVVTGASSGIGKALARDLAMRGARVIMACRDDEKCYMARRDIVMETKNQHVVCRTCDLSSQESVREFAARMNNEELQVNILVNNAGVMRCPQSLTKEGIELQLGVNHMGHFLLTNLLLTKIKASKPARIISVISIAYQKAPSMHFEDLNSERSYNPEDAYNQSQLANILFTRELAKRLAGTHVTANCVNPGTVNTEITRHLAYKNSFLGQLIATPILWLMTKSARQGAQTILYAALDENLEGVSGRCFSNMKEHSLSDAAMDDEAAHRLWITSERMVPDDIQLLLGRKDFRVYLQLLVQRLCRDLDNDTAVHKEELLCTLSQLTMCFSLIESWETEVNCDAVTSIAQAVMKCFSYLTHEKSADKNQNVILKAMKALLIWSATNPESTAVRQDLASLAHLTMKTLLSETQEDGNEEMSILCLRVLECFVSSNFSFSSCDWSILFSSIKSIFTTGNKKLAIFVVQSELRSVILRPIGKDEPSFIIEIWNTLQNSSLTHAEVLWNLCILFDAIAEEIHIFHDPAFWETLQKALKSQELQVTKRVVYLLKKCIETVQQKQIQISCELFWTPLSVDVWLNYFLVLETLEEKQAHIVSSVLPKLESLIHCATKQEQKIHTSWILALFWKAMRHDNFQIVLWTVMHFLKLSVKAFPIFDQGGETFITDSLLEVLRLEPLYAKANQGPELRELLTTFFQDCLNLGNFQSKLLNAFFKTKWSGVVCFHLSYVMSHLKLPHPIDSADVFLMRQFLLEVVSRYEPYLKVGCQCNLLCFIFGNLAEEPLSYESCLKNLYLSFPSGLQPGSKYWDEHLNLFSQLHHVIAPISANDDWKDADPKYVAFIMLSTMESLIEEKQHLIVMDLIIDTLQSAPLRLYLSEGKLDFCIKTLVEISLCLDLALKESSFLIIRQKLLECLPYIYEILTSSCFPCNDLKGLNRFNMWMNSLEMIIRSLQIEHLHKVIISSAHLYSLNQGHPNQHFQRMVLASSLRLLHILGMQEKLNEAFRYVTIEELATLDFDSSLRAEEPELWNKAISDFVRNTWEVFAILSMERIRTDAPQILTSYGLQCLQASVRDPLVYVLHGIYIIVPVLKEDVSMLRDMLRLTWTTVFESRKCEFFWKGMEHFIKVTFHLDILMSNIYLTVLQEMWQDLLIASDGITGLLNIAALHLDQVLSHLRPEDVPFIIEMTVDLLLFGPMHRKDQRIYFEACEEIEAIQDHPAHAIASPHLRDAEVRILGVKILSQIMETEQLAKEALHLLLARWESLRTLNHRHFANSSHHRTQHRIMQAILLLYPSFVDTTSSVVLEWGCRCLASGNPQPSVRYMQEWLIVLILNSRSELHDTFYTFMSKASVDRIGGMGSFVSILCHLVCLKPSTNAMERAFSEILPWCMSQHFSARVYAQAAILKMWKVAEDQCLEDTLKQYRPIHTSIQNQQNIGTLSKNADKLLQDFYFQSFNSLQHYSLQTIYNDLPRLAQVSRDEWIPLSVIKLHIHSTKWPLQSQNEDLANSSSAIWILKQATKVEIDDPHPEKKSSEGNVQKKLIPWKALLPDLEALEYFPTPLQEKKFASTGGLILVASLVSKSTNLGGLCRTCEVFGVSQLVLASFKYIDDPQFQSLSVTAEKWISMLEVKPDMVAGYLRKMKTGGYTMVGVEQAASSTQLGQMIFPKKTLLLLGNEREGIPMELLNMMDTCVEIPQVGVIRSLNVHVSGALLIWEYAKQHMLKLPELP
ncbi:unnamed protein product [Darwinula stevensoni]|uniref:tRNA (guanosine(18)-2'-O)-methyltransferase TARBP1 n=1 Tax=Darwinula stevensoni TaxID=69355 RepID=A0A7R8XKB9_9CRUS|nr:unnamed protein product [Darwinula stevensoni]CAG0895059.1 unnamed protein product [Darwinula stevensoni]